MLIYVQMRQKFVVCDKQIQNFIQYTQTTFLQMNNR